MGYKRKEQIGDCALYLGDCLKLGGEFIKTNAIITDPPYGIDWDTDYTRFSGGVSESSRSRKINGDETEFNPSWMLNYDEVILWGANHFSDKLPHGTWLVWDKRPDCKHGEFLSDCELAWQNSGHGVYLKKIVWDGFNRQGERKSKRVHPTQKPIGLMKWCIERVKSGVVVDPYMGSGTTGVACVNLRRKFIGIEICEDYFDVACRRIERAVQEQKLDLFAEDRPKPQVAQPTLSFED